MTQRSEVADHPEPDVEWAGNLVSHVAFPAVRMAQGAEQ